MLEFANITKSFGTRRVLDGLTFRVRPGEVYGLLGPNGAGKSTTFNIICNLLVPDSGTVLVQGRPPSEQSRSVLGVVAQRIALYRNLTCRGNLRFFGEIYGLRGADLARRTDACLAEVHLTSRGPSLVRDLSGGMQRRLHVAVALMHAPDLVILDEPSAGLDVESRRELWGVVRRLQQAQRAVLLTTHLLDEAEALCTEVGLLCKGRIVEHGSPEELRRRIPAVEVALIRSGNLAEVEAVAQRRGLTVRPQENGVAVWLARKMELREVLALFDGIPIDSIARRPVTLEDAYLELIGDAVLPSA
jgi:ABC-2 type transport system ATP-binding protein